MENYPKETPSFPKYKDSSGVLVVMRNQRPNTQRVPTFQVLILFMKQISPYSHRVYTR